MEFSLTENIQKLRQLTQIDVHNNWCYPDSTPAIVNEKGYIIWNAGSVEQELVQKIVVPSDLQGYPLKGLSLRLALTWWASKAQVFVNGKLIQEGDLFESSARILLTESAYPNQEIIINLRLISPSHDIGALMRSKCIYESTFDPGFVADELTVLQKYLENFAPEKIDFLATQVSQINWDIVSSADAFNRQLAEIRDNLSSLSVDIKQRCLSLLGHAHLDLAWLWTVEETWKVAQKTFTSVLSLQQDFPDLTFCHSTSALYAEIEESHPDLFAAIKQAISQQKWEVVGGMWVEPDVNLISGESIVRQLLYGQLYLKAKFGSIAQVAWLPDSFGFTWQLPQILSQSGIKYFVTGKLHWNDTTKFPHGVFWWQSPDGSRILTLISPPNVTGVMDTNPLTMTDYAISWEKQTGLKTAFWLPGVGDHGGGPTRDMLEVQRKWQSSPFFPRLQFTLAAEYLQSLPNDSLPTWNDELYLEFHRGCYTTHAEQKFFNRYCEGLLYQAELFSSLAYLLSCQSNIRAARIPILLNDITKKIDCQGVKAKITQAWKKVLFNQFHDILPGTSIQEVFVEASKQWLEAIEIGEEILLESLQAIASLIEQPSPPHPEALPLIVFNGLNWQRTEVVGVAVNSDNWGIYNQQGEEIPSQVTALQILFKASDIPSLGYRLYWLSPISNRLSVEKPNSGFVLENSYLKVVVNQETGDLDSIYDLINQKEILKAAGNQLQAFKDEGQYWDAWNIDPNYGNYPYSNTILKSIEWLDYGEIQQSVRVVRLLGESEFIQDYILQASTPLLKIVTTVNWLESHVLVKAAFPLNLESDFVTYEIPCGAIARPISEVKWEVSALRWACLTDKDSQYSVSLLNNCKYGYDYQANQLRLTLLRSSKWPDPEADMGIHRFTYAVYPHQGDWREALTVHFGYQLNLPLIVIREGIKPQENLLKPSGELLNLNAENLILMALKLGEEDDKFILRCYECHGQQASFSLEGDLGLAIASPVDLLEQFLPYTEPFVKDNYVINPYQIASFKLS